MLRKTWLTLVFVCMTSARLMFVCMRRLLGKTEWQDAYQVNTQYVCVKGRLPCAKGTVNCLHMCLTK